MKANLHSVSGVVTNSSTEMFTILKEDAISIAKKHLQAILDAIESDLMVDDIFDIEATFTHRFTDGAKEEKIVCHDDMDIQKALLMFTESAPDSCGVNVYHKESRKPLKIFDEELTESKEFMC